MAERHDLQRQTSAVPVVSVEEFEEMRERLEKLQTLDAELVAAKKTLSRVIIIRNRPNQEILVHDWLITSHVT